MRNFRREEHLSLVIADDHERERVWIKELLTKHLPQCLPLYEAQDGKQAVELALLHKPSLVFLDIEMPFLTGIKAAEKIIEKLPQTGIIILSNHSDEIWVRQLWKIVPPDSAFGYILKDATDQQVVDAARAVLDGDCWIHPRIQRILHRSEKGAGGLSEGEFEVLAYISLGLTDRAISKRLYVTEKAVQARLKSLYTKLQIPVKAISEETEFNFRCRAINVAIRRGLINKSELETWETKLQ